MKFTVTDFDDFMSCLTEVQTVCEDTNNSDELKNIIFQLAEDDMHIAGLSSQIQYKRKLTKGYSFEADPDQNGYLYIQLRSKDLIAFLGTYKASRCTKVKSLVFEFNEKKQIRLTVTESFRGTEQAQPTRGTSDSINMLTELDMPEPIEETKPAPQDIVSRCIFDVVPMLTRNVKLLENKASDLDYKELDPNILSLYTKTLTVASERTVYSYMNFTQGWVFVLSPSYVSFVRNLFVGDTNNIFSNIRLSSRVVNFFQKVLCTPAVTGTAEADRVSMLNNIDVARTEKNLVFKTDTVEASCIYDTNVVNTDLYFKMYVNDDGSYNNTNSIILDRVFFKDVIKRLSLKHDLTTVTFDKEANIISLHTPSYSQNLVPDEYNGFDDGKVTFEIMPDIFNKAILGADSGDESFEDGSQSTVRIAYSDGNGEKKRQGIIMSDTSDAWFSIIRVKTR